MRELARSLREHGTRLLLAEITPDVRAQFDRHGLTEEVGTDAFFQSVSAMMEAYHRAVAESG